MKISIFIFSVLIIFLSSCRKEHFSEEITSKYANGDVHIVKYYFVNDLKQKVYTKMTEYYPGNIKKMEGHLRSGYRDGKWTYWFFNGNKWSEGNFKYGMSHGNFTIWKENGSRYLLTSYKFGKPDGIWILWNDEGSIYKEVYYKQGKKVKEFSF